MLGVIAGLFVSGVLLLVSTAAAGASTSDLSSRRKRVLRYGFLTGSVSGAGSLILAGFWLYGLFGILLASPLGVGMIVGSLRVAPLVALGKKKTRLSPR